MGNVGEWSVDSRSIRPAVRGNQIFWGTFVHSKSLTELDYLHNTAVCVDASGTILAVESAGGEDDLAKIKPALLGRLGWSEEEVAVQSCKAGQFFFPGFIDTHIHASQYPNNGIFGKSTLMDWLNTYTFPLEASLKDLALARRVYGRCVRKTLSHGTTTAAYFATIDVPSTNLLADLCLAAGQRALVGRVCMDRPDPDFYRDESVAASLQATRDSIAHIRTVDPDMQTVRPIITPRFAPSCTGDLLRGLGELYRETGLPVQTHISENPGEIAIVRAQFPEARSYADVYDRHGLLTPHTILAHAIHLSDEEAALVGERGAKVAHCPCSNSAISSGLARVRWLLDRGIDVGLGTDVSGGYSPSVLEAARQACLVSNQLAVTTGDDGAKLSIDEVLYLATRGGAKVVGLEGKVGGFEVGMDFDAQLIGLCGVGAEGECVEEDDEDGNVDVFGWESWEDRVAKWLFNGDDRNTKKVWVRGGLVHERKGRR